MKFGVMAYLLCTSHDFAPRTGNRRWDLSKHKHRVTGFRDSLQESSSPFNVHACHLGSCENGNPDPGSLVET